MNYSRMARLHTKTTHFRTWKSGKIWLYGAALIAAVGLGAAVPSQAFGLASPSVVYAADSTAQTITLTYYASNTSPSSFDAWVWQGSNGGVDVTLTKVSGNTYTGTFTGDGETSLHAIIKDPVAGTTNWNNQSSQLDATVPATGASQLSWDPTGNGGKGWNSGVVTNPTITAPADVTKTATVAETSPIASDVTISDPGNLGKGTLSSISITGPSGSTYSNTVITAAADGTYSFTPDLVGQYTVNYNYDYSNLDTTTSTATAVVNVQAATAQPNTITTPAGPTFTQGEKVDLSPATQGVTTSGADTSAILGIQSVTWTPANGSAQTLSPNTDGTYTFPTSGTYSVVYKDTTGATATMSGSVKAQPAAFAPVADAKTTGVVGTDFDAASLESLTDPNDQKVDISKATITVTGPAASANFSTAQTLDDGTTTFTPDLAGDYTIDYSYVDGNGNAQSATQTVTISDTATLNADSSFEASKTVNATTAGTYTYDPTAQGVSVTDPENPKAAPTVSILDAAGNTLAANTDGTYTLAPAGIDDGLGDTSGTYYVTWSYQNMDTPDWDMQTITVLPDGYSMPTITTGDPSQSVQVDSVYDPTKDLTVTDAKGNKVDVASALKDGSLTIYVYDPAGNPVTLDSDNTFTPSMTGNYSIYYDYTDPTANLSATEQSVELQVKGLITPPADVTHTLTGTTSTWSFTPDGADKVTINDPQANQISFSGDSSFKQDYIDYYPYTPDPDIITTEKGNVTYTVTDENGAPVKAEADGSYHLYHYDSNGDGNTNFTVTYTSDAPNAGTVTVNITLTSANPDPKSGQAAKTVYGSISANNPSYDYGTVTLGDADNTVISLSPDNTDDAASVTDNGDGTYSLTEGTYQVAYSYTTYDPNNGNAATTTTYYQTVTVLPAPIISADDTTDYQLSGNDTTANFVPSGVASDGGTVTVEVKDSTGKAITANADGSYDLPAGTYTVSYSDDDASNSPLTETVTVTPAPTISANDTTEYQLSGKDKTANFVPSGVASDDGTVTVEVKDSTGKTVTANADGSYDLAAGTYTVSYSDDDASNSPLTETVTVTPAAIYQVTYDVNGGDTSSAPAADTSPAGLDYTVSSSKPTKSGYTFAGWLAGNGKTYQAGDPISSDDISSDLTLTAQWTADSASSGADSSAGSSASSSAGSSAGSSSSSSAGSSAGSSSSSSAGSSAGSSSSSSAGSSAGSSASSSSSSSASSSASSSTSSSASSSAPSSTSSSASSSAPSSSSSASSSSASTGSSSAASSSASSSTSSSASSSASSSSSSAASSSASTGSSSVASSSVPSSSSSAASSSASTGSSSAASSSVPSSSSSAASSSASTGSSSAASSSASTGSSGAASSSASTGSSSAASSSASTGSSSVASSSTSTGSSSAANSGGTLALTSSGKAVEVHDVTQITVGAKSLPVTIQINGANEPNTVQDITATLYVNGQATKVTASGKMSFDAKGDGTVTLNFNLTGLSLKVGDVLTSIYCVGDPITGKSTNRTVVVGDSTAASHSTTNTSAAKGVQPLSTKANASTTALPTTGESDERAAEALGISLLAATSFMMLYSGFKRKNRQNRS